MHSHSGLDRPYAWVRMAALVASGWASSVTSCGRLGYEPRDDVFPSPTGGTSGGRGASTHTAVGVGTGGSNGSSGGLIAGDASRDDTGSTGGAGLGNAGASGAAGLAGSQGTDADANGSAD